MTELLCRLFVKDHKNTSDPHVRASYGTMVSIVGILVNLLLFGAKITIGTIVASVAITADAMNNLSDAGSQIISLISFRISAKPADREHPFGHARIEYVASMIVSFLVLLIGVELLKESIAKIFSPELPERSWVAVGILGGSVLFKLWLGFFNRKIGKRIDSGVMRATAADSLSDALSTSAVLICTLLLLLFPSWNVNLDAYMGIVVAIFILIAGIKILLESKNSILGEAPSGEVVKEILETVKEYPEALGVHDMVVHNYGPGHIIASFHVEVDGEADIFVSHDVIDTIEQRLRRDFGIEATIHLDPIVTNDEEVAQLREQTAACVKRVEDCLQIHDFRFVKGESHSNLIFDVTVPFEIKRSDEELKCAISNEISKLNPSFFAVITVDRT